MSSTKIPLPLADDRDRGGREPETAQAAGRAAGAMEAPTGPRRIYDFADSLAPASTESERQTPVQLETWVTFKLDRETFALPVSYVQEILRIENITQVPHAPL